MKTATILALVFLASSLFAQNPTQPQPYEVTTIAFYMLQPPNPPSGVTVGYTGAPGTSASTYYYWLVSRFTVGNSTVGGPFFGFSAPATLSGSNFFTVYWQPVPGANSYDLLRTSSPAPPSGACNCAVATAISGTSQVDQSNSLSSYTVNTFSPTSALLQLSAEATGSGASAVHLLLRQSGNLICDISTGCGAGTGNLSGSLTSGVIPMATGVHALGNGSLTDNGTGHIGDAGNTGLTISTANTSFGLDIGIANADILFVGPNGNIRMQAGNPVTTQLYIDNGVGTCGTYGAEVGCVETGFNTMFLINAGAPAASHTSGLLILGNTSGGALFQAQDIEGTTYLLTPTQSGTLAIDTGVPVVPTGADASGATDSYAALQAAITAAIAAKKCLYVPTGTYKVSASLTAPSNGFCGYGAGASLTSITANASGYNTLVIGPGSVTYAGPNGHLSDLTLVGNSRTSDGHSALQLNGTVQYDVSRVTVDTADIGIDLINNNYGAQFSDIRGGFAGDLNVGINLRTGSQSGSDLTFYNPWISGVTAAIYAAGGGGGYHIWGGQLGAGIGRSSTCDACAAVVLGKDYLTSATGETTMDVHGTSFEGANDTWIFRAFNQVNLNTYGVYANPSDSGHPAIGFFKGESLANARMNIDGTVLSGYFSAANLVSLAGGNAGFKFWNETDTYSAAQNPTINSVSTYVFSMAAQSAILQQASVIDSNVTRTFLAQQYPGATVDVQVNACLADAIAVGGTCDASALGSPNVVANGHPNPQTLAAQIVVGDNNGDPVTLILPVSFWWEGTMTDGTSCDVKQFSATSIVGANVASAMPSLAAFVSSTGSSLKALFCIVQSTGQGAGNYIYDQGFQVNNGQYTGFGAVTVSGAAMLVQAGHIDDVSKFDHVIVSDKLDADAVILSNSVCCSTTLDGIQINGLQVSTPLFIDAESGFGMSAVHIVNSSIVHNGSNLPLIQITDNGSHTAVVDITNLYSEVYPATGGIIAIAGAGAVSLTNINLKAYSGSMTSPAVTVTNTVNTHLRVTNLNLTNGSGSWTEPCTQAIIDNFLGQTIPCLSITGVGYVGNYDTDPRFNNLRLQGGAGLGSGSNNLVLGDVNALPAATVTGANNTAFGANALHANIGANSNVAVGLNAGATLTSGGNNTIVGTNAGENSMTTTSNSTFIGNTATDSADGLTNTQCFGYLAQCTASNTTVIGNDSITDTYFGSSTATQKAKSNIHFLSAYEQDSGGFGSNQIGGPSACETTFGITTLNTGAATTDTGLNCLPANSVIDSVVYRITTTITTSASFTIGDATTAARFCSTQSTLTSGTTGICMVPWTSATAGTMGQASAAKVRVTLNANPGAGAIRLIVYYHTWTAPAS